MALSSLIFWWSWGKIGSALGSWLYTLSVTKATTFYLPKRWNTFYIIYSEHYSHSYALDTSCENLRTICKAILEKRLQTHQGPPVLCYIIHWSDGLHTSATSLLSRVSVLTICSGSFCWMIKLAHFWNMQKLMGRITSSRSPTVLTQLSTVTAACMLYQVHGWMIEWQLGWPRTECLNVLLLTHA